MDGSDYYERENDFVPSSSPFTRQIHREGEVVRNRVNLGRVGAKITDGYRSGGYLSL